MDDWGDDWEEYAQSSKPKGKGSKTFDGLDDIVDDYDAQSSMPKTKKLKKAETRRAKSKQAPKPTGNPPPPPLVNPDEPVRATWVKVPTIEFERDRLLFNPYAFGHSTCPDDPRFYCKMHQQVYHQCINKKKNKHVPTSYFNVEHTREVWPDVMELMDYHQISKLMPVSTPYSPELLKQFYATVHFSTVPKRSMTWMCHTTVCTATLAEFGALFQLEELPFAPCYSRIHCSKVMPAEVGIRHCYPPGIGLHGKLSKTSWMYHYWRVVHGILRNCLNCKFGEKGEVRQRMINLLHQIVPLYMRKKQIDILDYMWQEMRLVVLKNKVPIYGPYLQTLFNTKLSPEVIESYEMYVPTLIAIPPPPPDAPVYVPQYRGQNDEDEDGEVPKKQNVIIKALKKMNCFFAVQRKSDYKAYAKQKSYNRNQRAIMTQLNLPVASASSEEVSEDTYMAQNKYTFWFGDDASSLAPYWQGDPGQSSSGPAAHDDDEYDIEDEEEDDDEE